ncbi:hypothetical protein R3I93_020811 [Phoxinus phoxinus]|uniref:Uncharacterized protein n=1 Tax=Phoxinus phoxinus TaxID=58324 RepID=A0AAN9GS67_9TELE
MGQTPSYSQEEIERYAICTYIDVLQNQLCLLPDVGIDDSLLKYSGPDSNAVLHQAFSKEMLDMVPRYIASFGSAISALESVPNAVGLGALVISLIIEIAIKASAQTSDDTDDTYSLIRRVFGEEKASDVQDTMSEYLKRHQVYMKNNKRLRVELRRLEQQLSNHLTALRNSLKKDGQMSSRGLKIWVNGAAFHVQMLIHAARLDIQAGKPPSDCVKEIKAAINVYLRYLDLQVLWMHGERGPGLAQFYIPHSVAVDSYQRVWVADRGNKRIQVFNSVTGDWLGSWGSCFKDDAPYSVRFTPDQKYIVVAQLNTNQITLLEAPPIGIIGQCQVTSTIELAEDVKPHLVDLDLKTADLYVAEIGAGQAQKFVPL